MEKCENMSLKYIEKCVRGHIFNSKTKKFVCIFDNI